MIQLRDYQQQWITDLRDAIRAGSRAPLGVLPTGGGKTVGFTYMAQQASERGNRVLILVHRKELLRQCSETLDKFGVYHGRINPHYSPDYGAAVQVGSVGTVVGRMHLIQPPNLIIIDEAHHATANTWRTIIAAYPNAVVIGVTATPCRGDGIGLGVEVGGVFDSIVEGPQIADLIDRGFLVKPRLYRSAVPIDFKGIRTQMGDYQIKAMEKLVNQKHITGDAIDHYRKLLNGDPAIAFCCNVNHAKAVAAQARDMGYKSEAVYGNMAQVDRDRVLMGLADGSVQVVTSCDVVSEGTDIPVVTGAILLRKTKSLGLYIQQVGRVLRKSPGKDYAIILDHVHNSLMHGGVHWRREWSLDGETKADRKKREEEAELMNQCKVCFASYDPSPVCPYCGHAEVQQMKPPTVKAGELVEVSDEEDQVLQRLSYEERDRRVSKATTMRELSAIGKQMGYKPGWAYHQAKNKGITIRRKKL